MGSSLSSTNAWILSLKVLLLAFGVVSVSMAVEYIVPLLLDFAVNDLPAMWSLLQSYLKPPYLYLLINVIIFTIFATSSFHHRIMHENQSQPPLVNPPTSNLQGVPIQHNFGMLEPPLVVYDTAPIGFEDPQPPISDLETAPMNDLEVAGVENEDEFVISRSSWNPPPQISNYQPPPVITQSEKPLFTSRFAHPKQTKTSPDGYRALKVSKPKKQETLESTWKTITDGRRMPLTRHLRKSETFENHRNSDVYPLEQQPAEAVGKGKKVMKKASTLRDRTNYDNQNNRPPSPASGGKVRKDGSLSHDELNRRVEAFIKKFNDEMRLQRQESMKQYTEMTNRGTH
ncbi:uncharacterized protein LOC111879164 [Lactuca sativa]|uniref:DUF4408 domain-containing protein n=1 Tax=Lactuca sativa TaxID=4236 RepID=A0A9R1WJT1_LACSA|nr:uncharacterized protein LOC111879164 [Lactuca sativa]KAJ0224958.1 hypothetical protein LSAT_V11C100048650 [Lactuca sativa]